MRRYPWESVSKKRIVKFVVFTLLVFPLVRDAIKGYRNVQDRAWFFHIPACWITLLIYGGVELRSLFGKVREEDRSRWQVS